MYMCLRLIFLSTNFRKTALLRNPAIRIGGKESPKGKSPEKLKYPSGHYTLACENHARGQAKQTLLTFTTIFLSLPFLALFGLGLGGNGIRVKVGSWLFLASQGFS
jgi:hypothetical protein